MKSIISKKEMDNHMDNAKAFFKEHGKLEAPLLILNVGGEIRPITVGKLFSEYDKRFVMSRIGDFVKEKTGGEINEAVMIFESWFAKPRKGEKMDVRPSEHPDKQEAIIVIGRNKSGKKCVSRVAVINPKTRKLKDNDKEVSGMVGLLDYLFDEGEARLKEKMFEKKNVDN